MNLGLLELLLKLIDISLQLSFNLLCLCQCSPTLFLLAFHTLSEHFHVLFVALQFCLLFCHRLVERVLKGKSKCAKTTLI